MSPAPPLPPPSHLFRRKLPLSPSPPPSSPPASAAHLDAADLTSVRMSAAVDATPCIHSDLLDVPDPKRHRRCCLDSDSCCSSDSHFQQQWPTVDSAGCSGTKQIEDDGDCDNSLANCNQVKDGGHSASILANCNRVEDDRDCANFSKQLGHIDLEAIWEQVDDNSDVGHIDVTGAEEVLIREMMHSLEQAIGRNTHAEDSLSSSSSPTSNTSNCGRWGMDREQTSDSTSINLSAPESLNIILDDHDGKESTFDEEIRQLLQQAADGNALEYFYGELDEYPTTFNGADLDPFLDIGGDEAALMLQLQDHNYMQEELPFNCF